MRPTATPRLVSTNERPFAYRPEHAPGLIAQLTLRAALGWRSSHAPHPVEAPALHMGRIAPVLVRPTLWPSADIPSLHIWQQRATQGVDPFVEGVKMRIVAPCRQVDASGGRTAPDQLILLRLRSEERRVGKDEGSRGR